MFLESTLLVFIAFLFGIIAGSITGLAPGIHINLIAALLLASLNTFDTIPPLVLAIFIVVMSLTHTLLDFIPAIFLGVPEEESFLALLPGHQLLKEGRGYEALVLMIIGALIGLIILIFATPLYILGLPVFYPLLKEALPFILIALSIYLVARDDSPLKALFVFTLSGLLGLLTFNLPVKEPLMPLLTGLFGCSALLLASPSSAPKQKQIISPLAQLIPSKRELVPTSCAALIAAPLCSFLPGIGSGHAATLGSEIIHQNNRSFLMLIGAINVLVMSLSFVTVYAIGRARSGSAAAVQDILQTISLTNLMTILLFITLTILITTPLALFIAARAATLFNKINYVVFSRVVLAILAVLTLIFSNLLGFVVLVGGMFIGIFCIQNGTRRIHLMAALILPTIVFYLMH